MMEKYIFIALIALLIGLVIGLLVGQHHIYSRMSDGICIRADDGEVYLRLSEIAQEKLADPETKALVLKVVDASTRNKQSL